MLYGRIQTFLTSIRPGLNAGFAAGLIIVFLILIGVPVNIPNLALFVVLFVALIFGVRIGRRLRDEGTVRVLWNGAAVGVGAMIVPFLLMSLINSWQAKGIDVKQYFNAVDTHTTSILSGVPEDELDPNPARDPLTGEFRAGAALRTNPMRLTFDTDTALVLQFGLTGDPLFSINLGIGGFYGFMLLLVIVSVASAGLTLAAIRADLARYRQRASSSLGGNPITHWIMLLLPLILFGLFWLTRGQGGGFKAIIDLGGSAQQVQLFTTFLIILFGLVSIRSTQPNDHGLNYTMRAGIITAVVVALTALAAWRISASGANFIGLSDEPRGSETLSIGAIALVAAVLIVQNLSALRRPGRFESQLAATSMIAVIAILPLYLNQYQNDVLTWVGINVLLGLGLNIVIGYAGMLDLGYVAFFALGAYAYAFLSSNQMVLGDDNQPVGLRFAGNDEIVVQIAAWITLTAIVAGLVISLALRVWKRSKAAVELEARPSRRLLKSARPYPSMGTTLLLILLAVGMSAMVGLILDRTGIYEDIFNGGSPFLIGLIVGFFVSGIAGIMLGIPVLRLRGDYLAIVTLGFGEIIRLLFTNLRDFTGGPQGILQIPRPLPDNAKGSITYLALVYLVLFGAGLVAFFSTRLKASRIGRAWNAMRSDESIAQSMGVNLVQTKLMAFAIGAAFAGIGGVLFAARQRNIYPADFDLNVSITVLSLVIIGGMGSIPGVIMGAIVLIGIPEMLRELATYRILAFGALLVAIIIIRPEGLLPAPPAQLQERARQLIGARKESQT